MAINTTRLDKLTSRRAVRDREPIFSDFRNNFTSHPETKKLLMNNDESSVKRSIRNILLTRRSERFFNPEFGGGLDQFLFENISPVTTDLIKDAVRDNVERFEPRVRVIDVLVVPNEFNNSYEITLYFEVINSESPQSVQLTLYRVR